MTDVPLLERDSGLLKQQSATPFDLFWDANRANEHKQSRALGLLEKMLSEGPADVLMMVCKACLMIQMSQEWDRAENRDRAISVALDIIQESSPATPDSIRYKIEFAVGISLAQLPSIAGLDATSAGILHHLVGNIGLQANFDPTQQQEAFVALGAVYQAMDDPDRARRAFVAGRALGLAQAADIFGDYHQLKCLTVAP